MVTMVVSSIDAGKTSSATDRSVCDDAQYNSVFPRQISFGGYILCVNKGIVLDKVKIITRRCRRLETSIGSTDTTEDGRLVERKVSVDFECEKNQRKRCWAEHTHTHRARVSRSPFCSSDRRNVVGATLGVHCHVYVEKCNALEPFSGCVAPRQIERQR